MERKVLWYVLLIIVSYLIGGINPSYIISRIKGFDIRKRGSGNAGGSNALITMGWKIGVLCMIFDILKAFFVVKFALKCKMFIRFGYVCATTACILGHMFPVFMRFKGGKGLACLGGSILAYNPLIFLVMLTILAVIAFSIDYICVVAISASIVFPIIYYLREGDLVATMVLLIATVCILIKHRENVVRIKNGTEAHLSFIWNRDKEIETIQDNRKSPE